MAAAENGHIECVNLLIQAGAELDIRENYGNTALMVAAVKGHMECTKLLM